MFLRQPRFVFVFSSAIALVALYTGSTLATAQSINEVTTSYNTITLTHQFNHTDDVPVTCNGSEEQPMRYNVLTGKHNTTIFRPEGTVCNLVVGETATQNSGGFNLATTLVAETQVTPDRPTRQTRYFVSPTGTGVSESLAAPGSLEETLTSNLEDVEIFFFPGTYKDVGEIRADNLSGVTLIGNGAIIDGSKDIGSQKAGDSTRASTMPADTWVPIGNGIWENTDPNVVDPNYLMMLFDDNGWGTGTVIQHAGTSADRQEVYGIDYDAYWSTSPDKKTWWIRMSDDESPSEHEMVRFSKEYGVQFNNGSDIWIEGLQIQNYGKVTTKGASLFPNRNRILEFIDCSSICLRNLQTRHSTSQSLFFSNCNQVLIDSCAAEHRRFQTHNRGTIKSAGPPSNLLRYGWESSSSAVFFCCDDIVARKCSAYGVSDWCQLHDCSHANIHDNAYTRVAGENLVVTGDSRSVCFWNNRIHHCEIQGPFAMQSRTGPVWFINNASIDSAGWSPKDDLSGEVPAGEDLPNNFQFLGWSGTTQKFNAGSLPILAQTFFFYNTGIIKHTFEERYIWDARQPAFAFGGTDQIHSDTRSRNNVWASSGTVFTGGNPLDNLDFDFDQLWADDLQGLGWKYSYPHGIFLDDPTEARHTTFDSFREASGTYPNSGVEVRPFFDPANPFNVINRSPGEHLPGITNNALFNNPQELTGAVLVGQ